MVNKEQLLDEFSGLMSFVESLSELGEQLWVTPLGEGKWTTRDVMAHILLWDEYFLEGMIAKISTGQPLTLKHIDFNEFNNHAIEFAKTKSKQEIIELTKQYRAEIIRHLQSVPEEEYSKEFSDGDGHKITVEHYLKDFTSHDLHHINQIQHFIGTHA